MKLVHVDTNTEFSCGVLRKVVMEFEAAPDEHEAFRFERGADHYEVAGVPVVVRKWEHAGMTCAIRHGAFGAPCGYVRIPDGHPLHDVWYGDCDVDAYGGLTFSGELPGEEGFWLGFDMGHIDDMAHISELLKPIPVRTDEDCEMETNRLAEMLAEMGK